MLRQCTQRLLDTAEFIRSIGRLQTTAVSSAPASAPVLTSPATITSVVSSLAQPNSATTTSDTVRNEHNRLFGYRPPAPARSTRQQRGNNRGRGRFSPYRNTAVGRANLSWSRSFVCLARAGQQTQPNTAERIDLSLNGLATYIVCSVKRRDTYFGKDNFFSPSPLRERSIRSAVVGCVCCAIEISQQSQFKFLNQLNKLATVNF